MSIQTRKLASDPEFAAKVRNQNATRPVIPVTPPGQQIENPFVARPWDEGREPYEGQIVLYYTRRGDHYDGRTVFPAMILKFSHGGQANLLVFRGPREGDWVHQFAPQRTEENKEGAWEFAEPEAESPYALHRQVEALTAQLLELRHKLAVLEAHREAADEMDREDKAKAADASGSAPRPPRAKH